MIKEKFNRFVKMLMFANKETSVLGQRKYGEIKQNKLADKSVLSSRRYSAD